MPTSGVTNWSLTATQICTAAAQEIGVIGSGEELDATELTDCLLRLNGLLKSWSVRANLFREATGEVTVPADSGSGTLPQSVREINQVRLVISATNERPLALWNRSQYLSLPNKTTEGDPTIAYVSKGVGLVTVYVWPIPTTEKTLKIDYSRTAETVTAGTETVDIPQEWQYAVIKGTAVEIANIFGAARVDPTTLGKVSQEAQSLYGQLLDADRPDTYVFEPYDGYC